MIVFAALTVLSAIVLGVVIPGADPDPVRTVVPPVVSSPIMSSPASGADEEDSFEAAELQLRLRSIATSHAGVYGVVVRDPSSGQTVSINASRSFYAASIGKLPALYSLYSAADEGELSLDDSISILPTDIQSYGAGVLQGFPAYSSITLRECAGYLIQESDNTAWVMLDRRLGEARIGRDLAAIGAEDTDYVTHATTPEDVLTMLETISDPSRTSASLSEEMLRTMTDTAYEDRIPAALPPDVRVAHKVGSYDDSFGDAGVVSYRDASGKERTYYVVILSEGTTEADAGDAIREMAATIHTTVATPDSAPQGAN